MSIELVVVELRSQGGSGCRESMSRGDSNPEAKVYVGDLDPRADKKEVEEPFAKIGPLKYVWVARNPPGFAFVEFEDPRDAQDACRFLDGSRIGSTRIRVEMSRGGSGGRRGGGGGGGRMRAFSPRRSPAFSPRRSPRYSPRYSPRRSPVRNRYSRSRSRSFDRYRRSRDRSRSP